MAEFTFTGAYPMYYPSTGLYAKPGEVHNLDAAPDGNWALTSTNPTVAVAPPVVVEAPAPVEPTATPVRIDGQPDAVAAAEALLEANPALAAQIVKEAAQNA